MVKPSEIPFDIAGEARFRHGFTHGVQEVLRAVEPHLSIDRIMLLRRWAENDLGAWLMSDEQFVVAPHAPDLSTRRDYQS